MTIESIESYYLHTVMPNPSPFTIYHTVTILPARSIHATIALSAMSPGSTPQGAGGGGGYIKRWGFISDPGHEVQVDPPPDFEHNAVSIPNCTFITFGLTCEIAWAIAVATIHYYARS